VKIDCFECYHIPHANGRSIASKPDSSFAASPPRDSTRFFRIDRNHYTALCSECHDWWVTLPSWSDIEEITKEEYLTALVIEC
jgi:hypothetical protein